MTFGLAIRITLALVVILAAGVAVTTVLSAHMFERTLSDFLTSRFEFELNDVRHASRSGWTSASRSPSSRASPRSCKSTCTPTSRKQGWWAGPQGPSEVGSER